MTFFYMQLGTMRKPQEFCAHFHTRKDGSQAVMIQSDRSIGEFDAVTGQGVLNIKGSYFVHLNALLGARPLTLTQDQLAIAREHALKPGQELGAGIIFGGSREV